MSHNIVRNTFTNNADWLDSPTIFPPIVASYHNVFLVRALASQPPNNQSYCISFAADRSNYSTGKTLLAHALSRFNWALLHRLSDGNDVLSLFTLCVVNLFNK